MQPNITGIASLIAEPARASILLALMSGKAHTASELACEASITAQTASSHLAKLVEGKLLIVRKQGRHKYFQLFSFEVAELLETLLNMSATARHSQIPSGPKDLRLRTARVCYDHLAGNLGVSLFYNLSRAGLITEEGDAARLTQSGIDYFENLGIDNEFLRQPMGKRPLCRACLDWSERRSHLGGVLGKWILDDALSSKWFARDLDSRALLFTDAGLNNFKSKYNIL